MSTKLPVKRSRKTPTKTEKNKLPVPVKKKQIQDLDKDESLQCMLILLQKMCNVMLSKSNFSQVLREVMVECKKQDISKETAEVILTAAVRERLSNPINAALDSMGDFW